MKNTKFNAGSFNREAFGFAVKKVKGIGAAKMRFSRFRRTIF
jgi:hypothetical protein